MSLLNRVMCISKMTIVIHKGLRVSTESEYIVDIGYSITTNHTVHSQFTLSLSLSLSLQLLLTNANIYTFLHGVKHVIDVTNTTSTVFKIKLSASHRLDMVVDFSDRRNNARWYRKS